MTDQPISRTGPPRVRDAQATRGRLLDAAAVDFAENGIAGARVDRIAEAAGVGKPMIYSYFGDKQGLFDAVFTRDVLAVTDDVPFDVADLPGYTVRAHDHYVEHPRLWRLLMWARLERQIDAMDFPEGQAVRARKEADLSAAQASGQVASHLPASELLRALTLISQMWCTAAPAQTESEQDQRRRTVRISTSRLTDN